MLKKLAHLGTSLALSTIALLSLVGFISVGDAATDNSLIAPHSGDGGIEDSHMSLSISPNFFIAEPGGNIDYTITFTHTGQVDCSFPCVVFAKRESIPPESMNIMPPSTTMNDMMPALVNPGEFTIFTDSFMLGNDLDANELVTFSVSIYHARHDDDFHDSFHSHLDFDDGTHGYEDGEGGSHSHNGSQDGAHSHDADQEHDGAHMHMNTIEDFHFHHASLVAAITQTVLISAAEPIIMPSPTEMPAATMVPEMTATELPTSTPTMMATSTPAMMATSTPTTMTPSSTSVSGTDTDVTPSTTPEPAPGVTPGTTGEFISSSTTLFVPVHILVDPPTPTPTPEPFPTILNGNFEANESNWVSTSSVSGIQLIVSKDDSQLPSSVKPFNDDGEYFAWLGGAPGIYTLTMQSAITIPVGYPTVHLCYEEQIGSAEDDCTTDTAQMRIAGGATTLIELCKENDIDDWGTQSITHTVAVTSVIPFSVEFYVLLDDDDKNSNYFIDNVRLEPQACP